MFTVTPLGQGKSVTQTKYEIKNKLLRRVASLDGGFAIVIW